MVTELQFVMVYKNEKGEEVVDVEGSATQSSDDSHYAFNNSGLTSSKRAELISIPKRLNYNVSYFINDLVSQIDFTYINYSYQPFTGGGGPIYLNPGFNMFFQIGVNDLMEDHRIVGGIRLNFSFLETEVTLVRDFRSD